MPDLTHGRTSSLPSLALDPNQDWSFVGGRSEGHHITRKGLFYLEKYEEFKILPWKKIASEISLTSLCKTCSLPDKVEKKPALHLSFFTY